MLLYLILSILYICDAVSLNPSTAISYNLCAAPTTDRRTINGDRRLVSTATSGAQLAYLGVDKLAVFSNTTENTYCTYALDTPSLGVPAGDSKKSLDTMRKFKKNIRFPTELWDAANFHELDNAYVGEAEPSAIVTVTFKYKGYLIQKLVTAKFFDCVSAGCTLDMSVICVDLHTGLAEALAELDINLRTNATACWSRLSPWERNTQKLSVVPRDVVPSIMNTSAAAEEVGMVYSSTGASGRMYSPYSPHGGSMLPVGWSYNTTAVAIGTYGKNVLTPTPTSVAYAVYNMTLCENVTSPAALIMQNALDRDLAQLPVYHIGAYDDWCVVTVSSALAMGSRFPTEPWEKCDPREELVAMIGGADADTTPIMYVDLPGDCIPQRASMVLDLVGCGTIPFMQTLDGTDIKPVISMCLDLLANTTAQGLCQPSYNCTCYLHNLTPVAYFPPITKGVGGYDYMLYTGDSQELGARSAQISRALGRYDTTLKPMILNTSKVDYSPYSEAWSDSLLVGVQGCALYDNKHEPEAVNQPYNETLGYWASETLADVLKSANTNDDQDQLEALYNNATKAFSGTTTAEAALSLATATTTIMAYQHGRVSKTIAGAVSTIRGGQSARTQFMAVVTVHVTAMAAACIPAAIILYSNIKYSRSGAFTSTVYSWYSIGTADTSGNQEYFFKTYYGSTMWLQYEPPNKQTAFGFASITIAVLGGWAVYICYKARDSVYDRLYWERYQPGPNNKDIELITDSDAGAIARADTTMVTPSVSGYLE